jgi:hypothetical protein
MMFGDFRTEDDKLTFALEMAFAEISKDREVDEEQQSVAADSKQQKDARKKGHLGTHAMIKLPYVIGTPEYNKHPYAGIVYIGNLGEDLEQIELHNEEKKQLDDDKANEKEAL